MREKYDNFANINAINYRNSIICSAKYINLKSNDY